MTIHKFQLYYDLGLKDPKVFLQDCKEQRIKKLFTGVKFLLQNKDDFVGHLCINDSSRRTGRTTNCIIECLYHFYNGRVVAFKTINHSDAARIHRIIDEYRKILDPLYFSPMAGKYRISSSRDITFWLGYHYDVELMDVS